MLAIGKDCTIEQAVEIEEKASTLKTWDQVFNAWRLFNQCDDGAIAEGFSESITLILSTNWTEKGHLMELIEQKPNFEKFIIMHIDETVPSDRLSKLGHTAKMQCTDSTHDFCMKVLEKATAQ